MYGIQKYSKAKMELTKILANAFILLCLGGATYLIYYIQELNSKVREARRKEILNEVDEETKKLVDEIRSRPLADIVAKANERLRRIRRNTPKGE